MHFVHWNYEKYANILEASDKEDGLAVVGLLASVVGLYYFTITTKILKSYITTINKWNYIIALLLYIQISAMICLRC